MKETAVKLILTIVIMACLLLPIPAVAMLCLGSTAAMWTDDRSCAGSNPQILLLKSYIPTETLNEIPPDFYTYFGFRDWWRFPLVYPYSIQAVEVLDEGILTNESEVMDFETNAWQNSKHLLNNIQSFTFDRKYFLAKTSNDFIIFDFITQETQFFDNIEELIIEAERRNFTGKMEFITLREYDGLFTCSK